MSQTVIKIFIKCVEAINQGTLILPVGTKKNKSIISVGKLKRKEASELIVGYSFNLKTNQIISEKIPNPK